MVINPSRYIQIKDLSGLGVTLIALTDNNHYLYSLGGNDTLVGKNGSDVLISGDGDDYLFGYGGNDYLIAANGNDYLNGGIGNDTLEGGNGNDKLFGGIGNDKLSGGANNDYIEGNEGSDTILGDNGNDILYGGDGNDRIYAGNGNDILAGGTGNDYLYGGLGIDTYVFEDNFGRDYLIDVNNFNPKNIRYENILDLSLITTNTIINLNITTNAITSGSNTVNFYYLSKFSTIIAGQGHDVLIGNTNYNTIFNGGAGNDVFIGGNKNDTYIYELNDGTDIITDSAGTDTLDLSNLIGNITGITQIGINYEIEANLWTKSGNSLILDFGSGNKITINNYYTTGKIENLILKINEVPVFSGDRTGEVNEGSTYTITSSDLNTTDLDNTASQLTYTANNLINGNILVNGIASNTFTQADINNNLVMFQHNNSLTGNSSFNFIVSDGINTLTSQAFNITVNHNNIAPTLSGDRTSALIESSRYIITTADLNAIDIDTLKENLIYTINSQTRLIVQEWDINTNTWVNSNGSFTQAQIEAGQVAILHDGTESTTANFNFSLSDGKTTITNQTFNATITLKNDLISTNETSVSTYYQGTQSLASSTELINGNTVITWQSNGQDGDSFGIYGQMYDSNGNKLGNEFQINTYTTKSQDNAIVNSLNNGNFVVTWSSDGQDGSNYGVYAQIYDSIGNRIGSEFQVNTYTASTQKLSAISTLDNGNFVITWTSQNQDGNGLGVYAQIFNFDGSKIGNEFQINTTTKFDQQNPFITNLTNNNFLITWESNRQDGDNFGIFAQIFDSNGNKIGSEFQVNTYTTGAQSKIATSVLENGNFVISWTSQAQDGDNFGIFAQIFDSNGNKIDNEFQVNTYITNSQQDSSVSGLKDGGFVIAWQSYGQDSSYEGIFAQRYDSNGNKVGNEFQVNSYTNNSQRDCNVLGLEDGGFLVTWQSYNQDGNAEGIYSQRFDSNGNRIGDSYIRGNNTANLFVSTTQNDNFYDVYSTNDSYIFRQDFANDRILDRGGTDNIDLTDFTYSSSIFTHQEGSTTTGDDLLITIGSNSLLIENYFAENSNNTAGTGYIEDIDFMNVLDIDITDIAGLSL